MARPRHTHILFARSVSACVVVGWTTSLGAGRAVLPYCLGGQRCMQPRTDMGPFAPEQLQAHSCGLAAELAHQGTAGYNDARREPLV